MKTLIVGLLVVSSLACGPKVEPVVQNTNSASQPMRAEKLQTVTAHSTEGKQPPAMAPAEGSSSGGSKWSQSGEPIDTAKLDAAIASAEKAAKAAPGDEGAQKAAAEAYFNRGMALTDARQYAAALGDYRRALKYDPNDEDSKKWIDQIVGIYSMLKKQAPAEGQEPAPLPFKK